MAQIIVNFRSEQHASDFINHLSQVDLGEVRARVLSSSEGSGHMRTEGSAPMVTPDMGTDEVRPSETPQVPDSMHEETDEDQISSSVPVTGSQTPGVQVMIEVDNRHEETVRKMLLQFNE